MQDNLTQSGIAPQESAATPSRLRRWADSIGSTLAGQQNRAREIATAMTNAPGEMARGFIDNATERITQRLRILAEGVFQAVFFCASAASCYFIGLFSNIGLEYFSVIDKQSMLGSIFLLTALFSSIRVAISVLPVLLTEAASPSGATADIAIRHSRSVGHGNPFIWACAGIAFAFVVLGPFHGAAFTVLGLMIYLMFRHRDWRARLVAALVLGYGFGFLRAEYLREMTPVMAMHLASADSGTQQETPINVIMSADRGLLVVIGSDRSIRFVPWEHVTNLGPIGLQGGWLSLAREKLARLRGLVPSRP